MSRRRSAALVLAAQRSREVAEGYLRQYLRAGAKTDAAPAFRVHVVLGDALEAGGDHRGAMAEYAAARALASGYRAAQCDPRATLGG